MSDLMIEHPNEEALAEFALDRHDEAIAAHIAQCPDCARYIDELVCVKDTLSSIPAEDVPEKVRSAILRSMRTRPKRAGAELLLQSARLLRNPLIIGFGVIGASIFLYALFMYLT
jgi:anti-sigma factor RsiW